MKIDGAESVQVRLLLWLVAPVAYLLARPFEFLLSEGGDL